MKLPTSLPEDSSEIQRLFAHDMREMWNPKIARQSYNSYQSQIELYSSLVEGKNCDILDVGCAQGNLSVTLAEKGHNVVALDIRPAFLDYARRRYEFGNIAFVCSDVMSSWTERKYDVIFANQIIEHVSSPSAFVIRLNELLHPGGRLVVSTPNGSYFGSRLPSYSTVDFDANKHHFNSADGDSHFFAFKPEELAQVVSASGFGDVTVRYFETPLLSANRWITFVHTFMPFALLRGGDRFLAQVPLINKKVSYQMLVTAKKCTS